MGLSAEQRKHCADIYYDLSGGDNEMPDYRWNEKAAVQLYHLMADVRNCSLGVAFITTLPTSPFGAFKAAIKYISEMALNKYKISNSSSSKAMNSSCLSARGLQHISLIKAASRGF
ncbi:MAG: hypothetical protein V3U87_12600 [Methylococcaceae bacterium]